MTRVVTWRALRDRPSGGATWRDYALLAAIIAALAMSGVA